MKVYSKIQGQPFLLLYAKFSKPSIPIIANYIKGFTICMPPINKVIPINPDDGIYIISYCDNTNAMKLKPYIKNKKYMCKLFKDTINIKEDIKILALHHYYWENGTHYYKPHNITDFRNKILNPMKNMLVVGEMVAEKQGWINGTLQTSLTAVNNIILNI